MHLSILITFAALATAAPYAFTTPSTTHSVSPRNPLATGAASCSIPGQLLCHGLKKFALCTEARTITWMATSDGTSCVCNSHGDCSIDASTDNTPDHQSSLISSTPTPAASSPTPPTSSSTVPSATPNSPGAGSKYTQFNGNGSPQDGWPTMSDWLSFEEIFKANQPIGSTCETAFGVPNNQPNDTAALHDALLDQAEAAGVPPEFALVITLQESLGCVYVDTTYGSVANPGLMQDHDGNATCFGKKYCSMELIQQQLKQGLSGTSTGAGIKQIHQQVASQDPAQGWYRTARGYNAGLGSLQWSNLSADSGAGTNFYASDIANRLIGWI